MGFPDLLRKDVECVVDEQEAAGARACKGRDGLGLLQAVQRRT